MKERLAIGPILSSNLFNQKMLKLRPKNYSGHGRPHALNVFIQSRKWDIKRVGQLLVFYY